MVFVILIPIFKMLTPVFSEFDAKKEYNNAFWKER